MMLRSANASEGRRICVRCVLVGDKDNTLDKEGHSAFKMSGKSTHIEPKTEDRKKIWVNWFNIFWGSLIKAPTSTSQCMLIYTDTEMEFKIQTNKKYITRVRFWSHHYIQMCLDVEQILKQLCSLMFSKLCRNLNSWRSRKYK